MKDIIFQFMEIESNAEYQLLLDMLSDKRKSLKALKKGIRSNLKKDDLLSSYIHMMINRLFRDKQRLHELVCYDSLHKYYNFKLATKTIST